MQLCVQSLDWTSLLNHRRDGPNTLSHFPIVICLCPHPKYPITIFSLSATVAMMSDHAARLPHSSGDSSSEPPARNRAVAPAFAANSSSENEALSLEGKPLPRSFEACAGRQPREEPLCPREGKRRFIPKPPLISRQNRSVPARPASAKPSPDSLRDDLIAVFCFCRVAGRISITRRKSLVQENATLVTSRTAGYLTFCTQAKPSFPRSILLRGLILVTLASLQKSSQKAPSTSLRSFLNERAPPRPPEADVSIVSALESSLPSTSRDFSPSLSLLNNQ